MAFQPPRPWDELIKQLLGNVQNAAQATERGLQARREERMIGEERAFQVERDETRRQWQLDDSDKQREYELTDQANTARLGWINRLQASLPYVDPRSELYKQASALLAALTAPSDLTGQAAYDNALRAEVVIAGQPVIGSTIIAQTERAMRETERTEGQLEFLAEQALAFITDTSIEEEERKAYINDTILGSSLFPRATKEALLAAVVSNPDERRRILDEQRMSELGIELAEIQVADAAFNLDLKEQLRDFTYQEAQQRVWQNEQNLLADEVDLFWRTGTIPLDEERANRLAQAMNLSPEALEATGIQRFRALQRQEALAERAARLANEATESQINVNEVQALQARLTYDRAVLYGAIEEKKNLVDFAVAASLSGDTDTLRLFQNLANDPQYAETGLADLDLDGLMEIADEIKGDEASIRADNRLIRDTTRAQTVLQARVDMDSTLETIARGFIEEDFTLGENGDRPVDAVIRDYVDGFSAKQLRDIGLTSDELYERLRTQAIRQRVLEDRSDAARMIDMLLAGAIPEGESDQQAWLANITALAEQANLPPEVINSLATGALDASKRDVLRTLAEITDIRQRADLNYQETFGKWLANQATLAALNAQDAASATTVVSREQYEAMYDSYATIAEDAKSILTDDACALPTIDQQVLGFGFNMDEPICVQAYNRYNDATDRMAIMAQAVPVDGGFMLTYGNVTGVMGSSYEDVMDMPGVDWEGFSSLPPADQDVIAAFARGGMTPEEINLGIASIRAQDGEIERQRAAVEDLAPLSSLDVKSDSWYGMDFNSRTNALARTQEWVQLALDVLDGEVDLEDVEQVTAQAERFGWYRPPEDLGRTTGSAQEGLAAGLEGWRRIINPDRATAKQLDTDGFLMAIRATSDSLARSRTGQRSPDDPVIQQFYRSPDEVEPRPRPEQPEPAPPLIDLSGAPRPATAQASGIQQTRPQGPGTPAPGGTRWAVQPGQFTGRMPTPTVTGAAEAQVSTANSIMSALIQQESGGNHTTGDGVITSPAGALGITQIMPATAAKPGYAMKPLVPGYENVNFAALRKDNPSDYGRIIEEISAKMRDVPQEEYVRFGRDYLASLLAAFNGDVEKAIAAYNAGEGNVRQAVSAAMAANDPDWMKYLWQAPERPGETRNYVNNIMAMLERSGVVKRAGG